MSDENPDFRDPRVAAAFAAFPPEAAEGMLTLRRLIFRTAAETPGVGRIHETLKWGQPAYLTPETGSGSTIRLGCPKQGGFAIYAHCQTSVIADFAALFPGDFVIEGNRALVFRHPSDIRTEPIRILIASALTYHLRSKN